MKAQVKKSEMIIGAQCSFENTVRSQLEELELLADGLLVSERIWVGISMWYLATALLQRLIRLGDQTEMAQAIYVLSSVLRD
jgi:hypothetical protein